MNKNAWTMTKKMRNPNRIDRICEALRQSWHRAPDLRLGQLIVDAIRRSDPYYVEDDDMELAVRYFPPIMCNHPGWWPRDKPKSAEMTGCRCGQNMSCPVCGYGCGSSPCRCDEPLFLEDEDEQE